MLPWWLQDPAALAASLLEEAAFALLSDQVQITDAVSAKRWAQRKHS
jgi:hypothetical protein